MEDRELFAGTWGKWDAPIALVGESWGVEEDAKGIPLVGVSGHLSDSMLAAAGLLRSLCFITNVCSRRPPSNKMEYFFHKTEEAKALGRKPLRGLYPTDQTLRDLERLYLQLDRVRPKVIVAYGNWALWALCNNAGKIGNGKPPFTGWKIPTGIMAWRGSSLQWNTGLNGHAPQIPLIPTVHPAAIQRQWELKNMGIHDLRKRVKPIALEGRIEQPEYDFLIRPTFQQTLNWLNDKLKQGIPRWAVDLETAGGHIACVGFATSARSAISIPLMCVERPSGYFTPTEELVLFQIMRRILTSPTLQIVGQNYSYDMQYLSRFLMIRPKVDFDTMVMQHLAWPGVPAALYFIASWYNRYYRYWKDEGKDWNPRLPEDILWQYNCIDAINTWEASYHLEDVLRQLGLLHLLPEQMDVLRLQFEMMEYGVLIDKKARQEMFDETQGELDELEMFFSKVLSPGVRPLLLGKTAKGSDWWTSQSQLCRLFYDQLGIEPIRNKESGNPKMDDDALQRLKSREPLFRTLIEKLQDFRSLGVFHNTFLMAELDPDGRMRTEYTQAPSTFRWSSRKNVWKRGMNLQNIPKGDED